MKSVGQAWYVITYTPQQTVALTAATIEYINRRMASLAQWKRKEKIQKKNKQTKKHPNKKKNNQTKTIKQKDQKQKPRKNPK